MRLLFFSRLACLSFICIWLHIPGMAQDHITHAYVQTNQTIILRFNAPLDTLTAEDTSRYAVPGKLNIIRALVQGPEGRSLVLISDSSIADTSYTLEIKGVKYNGIKDDSVELVLQDVPVDPFHWWNIQQDTIANISHSAFWSKSHERLVGYSIYLPPGYNEADSLPAEYFLGGLGNDETVMYPKIAKYIIPAVESSEVPSYVVIWPNPMRGSWYLDTEDYLVETMITKELIPHVDSIYKTMKRVQGRWISGFSMGGFGSLNLGLRHTGLFSSVVSYAIARKPTVENPQDVRENLQIRMVCGEGDFYYPMEFTQTYRELQSLGIPVDYQSIPGVPHSIGGLYNQVGIKGLKFHWRTLGGFNKKPVVSAGEPILAGNLEPAVIRLDGRVRDDHYPGTSLSHYWKKERGPGLVVFKDSSLLNPEVYIYDTGDYRLVLVAVDGEHTATDTLEVRISPDKINTAPFVFAGKDRYLQEPDRSIQLSGTVRDDGLPEGGSLTMYWSAVEGPAPAALSDSLKLNATATFTRKGEYVLRLSGDDGELHSSSDLHLAVMDEGDPVPALRWRFNEGQGDTLYNCTGLSGRGILELDPEWIKSGGKEGSCLRFDGVENHARTLDATSLGLFRDPFMTRTISIWFKTDNNKIGTHMIYEEGGLQNGISISKSGGWLSVTLTGEERIQLDGLFNYTTGWQHVAVVFDRGEITAWLNGERFGQETAGFSEMGGYTEELSIGATLHTAAFSVGAGEGNVSHYLDGYVDDLSIFAVALPEAEIRRLAGIPVGISPLDVWYPDVFAVYPNPFKESVNLDYELNKKTMLMVRIQDLTGRVVKVLLNAWQDPGKYRLSWDGTIASGSKTGEGMYLLLIQCSRENNQHQQFIKKILLMK
jgi:enterochelin esterase-like enzyme